MNIFKGLNHSVKIFASADGKGLQSLKVKRPEDMSGRQWKKPRKAARRAHTTLNVVKAAG